MSPQMLVGLLLLGLAGLTISAIAVRVLGEIAWHELEERCKQKRRAELFGRIYELREEMQLGAEILQNLSTAFFAVMAITWLTQTRSLSELSSSEFSAVILLIAFVLVFASSWIPWAIARVASVEFLFHSWRWWWVVSTLAWPLTVCGRMLGRVFARASGQTENDDDEEEAFEDEILSMVSEGERDGYIESEAREMIEGVMELDDSDVRSVMTSRSRVDAMELGTNWEDMVNQVVESGRTRIPVYQEKLDNIVGLLYAKDLLRESLRSESKRRPLNKLLRAPLFVPEQTRLDEMLSQFLHARTHMAIIQDEYGGLAGVVTIEDVLEEIVGEIVDETDKDRHEDITILNSEQADVEGSVYIHRLNEMLGLELPDEENFDTVSGLVMNQLQEIPRPGHELIVGNVQFNIQEANRRQIRSVRVTRLDDDHAS
jgi:CBS domain containing-hemolysin-like protein